MSHKYYARVKEAREQLSKERAYTILRAPVVSEKSTLMSANNQMMFDVAKDASKGEIKGAIEKLFGVKVVAVNTLIRKGKTKRFRGRKGMQSDQKKAIVTLAEGQNLDLSAGI